MSTDYTSKYERPVSEVLSERSVDEVVATDSEKQALIRDTGVVAMVLTLDAYDALAHTLTVTGCLPGETTPGTYTFDVETLGLRDVLDAYAWQRPYWTTEELVRYRLSGEEPGRASEVEHIRLQCDENAVWTLEYLYTETQYERLFEKNTEATFRVKAKIVRRHGRVLDATDEPLFTRPVYAKYHESDGASTTD